MDESIKLSTGYRFNPFEEELITLYLKPKVLGQKLPSNVVEERQLYGPDANPWQLFDPENHSWILSEVSPGKFDKITYVFVNLTKKATAEKKNKGIRDNYNKKAGCGTWNGKTTRTGIRDCNGDLVGERRMLAFEINDVCDEDLSKVGHWRMHEYHLCGVYKDISNPGNTVLCKITLDSSKNPPVKLKLRSKGNPDHPIKSSNEPEKKNTNVHIVSSPSTVNRRSVECNEGVSENFEGAITTQTCRDDSVVSDSDRGKGKEGCYGTENVGTRAGVECVDSCYVGEGLAVIASSPSEEVKTGYLNLSISDFHWPAKNDNDCEKIKMEGEGGDLHFGTTKVPLFQKSEARRRAVC
ncbi:hypothetical protein POM88_026534 [Heracleum sosnowskyi]|uniref:NAC domain-containing protein n=1 Tax=Heracleum sosnowskyi TaxID=360622 RepID=A0AAD8I719_9APIA|nr:hypothetical protein POM88_026534 [Heracleum sosnowskyi]